jgi:hypothetical protein
MIYHLSQPVEFSHASIFFFLGNTYGDVWVSYPTQLFSHFFKNHVCWPPTHFLSGSDLSHLSFCYYYRDNLIPRTPCKTFISHELDKAQAFTSLRHSSKDLFELKWSRTPDAS